MECRVKDQGWGGQQRIHAPAQRRASFISLQVGKGVVSTSAPRIFLPCRGYCIHYPGGPIEGTGIPGCPEISYIPGEPRSLHSGAARGCLPHISPSHTVRMDAGKRMSHTQAGLPVISWPQRYDTYEFTGAVIQDTSALGGLLQPMHVLNHALGTGQDGFDMVR